MTNKSKHIFLVCRESFIKAFEEVLEREINIAKQNNYAKTKKIFR